ncbi:response regulator [Desulfosporosinus youngiae]|uniref:Stage 0 sporulation protein A homolog n=1 Tax=Desulfosporosinus youngiae DSM 17734 TaxID=768710 RepID=H5XUC2_9FIRM|nr:response regulator transcription factor [Desulfosporosinus youngiae]EHQ89358.1 response regulator containing a CheY-like receiver domain and an HTH DNA-binding domain [Desulfosporosinus youngiae DSM 17734]
MNVVSIDDYPLSRQGLMAVLGLESEFEFAGEASSVKEAREVIFRLKPEIIIIDLKLKDESGFDIISEVKELDSDCKVVILTSSLDPDDFKRASEFGVDGYILKDAMPEEIVNAVRLVSKGRKYYDPSIMEIVMKKENLQHNVEELTSRELEVLAALGKGLSNKDIAEQLFISEYTVKKHVSQIFGKLGLSCRTQAALYANKHKLGSLLV